MPIVKNYRVSYQDTSPVIRFFCLIVYEAIPTEIFYV
jgi:hypothetical protein